MTAMTECTFETSVTDWVIEHPETLAVFQELGIDYSCGGKSLEFACRERGFDERDVLSRLHQRIEAGRTSQRGIVS
jgi:regulator of cell morphogenesis and NO signaling